MSYVKMRFMHEEHDNSLQNYPRPMVMVDIAIFTVEEAELKVLLIKRGLPPYQDAYALPGGAVRIDKDNSLEAAAKRELIEETGVSNQYLEQLGTYGDAARDPRGWSISVAYFALVAATEVRLSAGSDATEAHWHTLRNDQVNLDLAFDHAHILQDAVDRLRAKMAYTDIAGHLLPEEFTLSDFQRVYEIVMQEKLNKSSFRQRVEKAGLVQLIPGKMRTGSNRPAQLYRFVCREGSRMFFPRSIVWAERRDD